MEQAQRLIDDEHPLKDTPIRDVLPVLRRCCCKLPSFIPNSREPESSDSDEEAYGHTIETKSDRTDSVESDVIKPLIDMPAFGGWFKPVPPKKQTQLELY